MVHALIAVVQSVTVNQEPRATPRPRAPAFVWLAYMRSSCVPAAVQRHLFLPALPSLFGLHRPPPRPAGRERGALVLPQSQNEWRSMSNLLHASCSALYASSSRLRRGSNWRRVSSGNALSAASTASMHPASPSVGRPAPTPSRWFASASQNCSAGGSDVGQVAKPTKRAAAPSHPNSLPRRKRWLSPCSERKPRPSSRAPSSSSMFWRKSSRRRDARWAPRVSGPSSPRKPSTHSPVCARSSSASRSPLFVRAASRPTPSAWKPERVRSCPLRRSVRSRECECW
mmetsp:Transcript_33981/g.112463  ORF Transcript_33981/g.112463 Transcript_33981/m.112463 type:complete len:285 (-) Transcript_33981:704-1558(-)